MLVMRVSLQIFLFKVFLKILPAFEFVKLCTQNIFNIDRLGTSFNGDDTYKYRECDPAHFC